MTWETLDNIELFADPVQIYEGDGGENDDVPVEIEITAILDGPALGTAVVVPFGGANVKGTASRDMDFDISAPAMRFRPMLQR